jgi:hypothetical protein
MAKSNLSLDNENVRLVLIVAGIAAVFYFLHRYYSNNDEDYVDVDEGFENADETSAPAEMNESGEYNIQQAPENNMQIENNIQVNNAQASNDEDVAPAEDWGMNERPRGVDYLSQDGVAPGQIPNECYPKDTLKSADLLPGDANSVWAQVNPLGQGALGDQNLLNSGYHIGINTVGQTLRNPSHDLRSEYPNPQVPVSPWMQTTIEPDLNRRPMEIGSGY